MENTYDIFILPDGTVKFIFDDALRPVLDIGISDVRRASHVELEETEDGLKWFADMSLVEGPKLGPFDSRDLAVKEEINWLNANISDI